MVMHLLGPHYTTTQYNRKRKKAKNKRLLKAQSDHDSWLKSMGVGKSQPDAGLSIPIYGYEKMTSDKIPGNGTKKDRMQYTGEEIVGVATMHKSNLVPIRKDNKQAAIDAANMRRN